MSADLPPLPNLKSRWPSMRALNAVTESEAETYAEAYARSALAQAEAAKVPEAWISVEERMPEQNVEVLIAFRDAHLPATGQYTASPHDTWGWCFPGENDPEETGPITHWMPLPAPPVASQERASPPAEGAV